MKRKLLILIGITLPALMWAGKSTPYSTIFYGDDEWTITDANGDGKTWTKVSGSYSAADGAVGGIKYTYHNSNSGDDWCISKPAKNTNSIFGRKPSRPVGLKIIRYFLRKKTLLKR